MTNLGKKAKRASSDERAPTEELVKLSIGSLHTASSFAEADQVLVQIREHSGDYGRVQEFYSALLQSPEYEKPEKRDALESIRAQQRILRHLQEAASKVQGYELKLEANGTAVGLESIVDYFRKHRDEQSVTIYYRAKTSKNGTHHYQLRN